MTRLECRQTDRQTAFQLYVYRSHDLNLFIPSYFKGVGKISSGGVPLPSSRSLMWGSGVQSPATEKFSF